MNILKKILLICFSLIVLAGIGLTIFISNFDANKFKPQIIAQAERALGRKVDFKDIALEISLKHGIQAALREATIAEDPNFGSANFAEVKEVSLGVDILRYVKNQEISLSAIRVNEPTITLIKRADGQLNTSTLAKKEQTPTPATDATAPTATAAAVPLVLVDAIEITQGTLHYRDATQQPARSTSIEKLDVNLKHFSLTQPFDASIKLAAFADKQNVEISAKAQLHTAEKAVSINGFKGTLDLATLDSAKLKSLTTAPLPSTLKGLLTVALEDFKTGGENTKPIGVIASLSNGAVSFAEISPGVSLDIPVLEIALTKLSEGQTGNLSLKAAYLNPTPNINFNADVALDMQRGQLIISQGEITTDLSSFDLTKLKSSIASLKEAKLPEQLKGSIAVSGLEVRAGGGKPLQYNAAVLLKEGSATLAAVPTPLQNINAELTVNPQVITLNNLALTMGEGSITARGKLEDPAQVQRFSLNGEVKKMPIAALLDQTQQEIKAQGLVSKQFAITGKGLKPDAMQYINGTAAVQLEQGALLNLNVLAKVLDKITFIPNLRPALEASLPRIWQQKLQQKDTNISAFSAESRINSGIATISPITLSAEGFEFEGTGTLNLTSKAYKLDGAFIMPQDMTAEVVKARKEMGYLVNEEQLIRFPLHVEGTGAQANFYPDVKYAVSNAMKNKGKDQLLRVLEKKLGKDDKNAPLLNLLGGALGKKQPAPEATTEVVPETGTEAEVVPAPAATAPAAGTPPEAPASTVEQAPQEATPPAPAPSPEQQLLNGVMQNFLRKE